jgi:hypothetical protein
MALCISKTKIMKKRKLDIGVIHLDVGDFMMTHSAIKEVPRTVLVSLPDKPRHVLLCKALRFNRIPFFSPAQILPVTRTRGFGRSTRSHPPHSLTVLSFENEQTPYKENHLCSLDVHVNDIMAILLRIGQRTINVIQHCFYFFEKDGK